MIKPFVTRKFHLVVGALALRHSAVVNPETDRLAPTRLRITVNERTFAKSRPEQV
jgi:hypothetical protein